MIHSFGKSFSLGRTGESWFLAHFSPEWKRNNIHDKTLPDFINDKGELLELKTDSYEPINFFMETHNTPGTLGGVYKAQKDGCKYFAYLFMKQNLLYLMHVDDCVKRTDDLIRSGKYKQKVIMNKTHRTYGYALPIDEYKDLFLANI